ncbi:MAG: ABC transporter permease [Hyphomicrobium sp.]
MAQALKLGLRDLPSLMLLILVRAIRSVGNLRANADALRRVWQVAVEKRDLVKALIQRQLRVAHAGRGLGLFWQFFHPLFIVVVYMVIFGAVIGRRLGPMGDLPGSYSSYILAGLVPWLITQNAMAQATGALTGNENLVKQVIFPIEVLPFATTSVAAITYAPALMIVLLHAMVLGVGLTPTLLVLPLLLALHFTLILGIAFALSSVTVFVRDIREVINVFSVVALYLMPVIYVPAWMPSILKPIIYLNPFSYLIWAYQDVLFFDEFQHPFAWAVLAIMAIGSLAVGARIFAKLKPYYGNAL